MSGAGRESDALSGMLKEAMADPEVMAKVRAMAAAMGVGASTAEKGPEQSKESEESVPAGMSLDPALAEALPSVMKLLGSLSGGGLLPPPIRRGEGGGRSAHKASPGERLALLCALKPYLSEDRCRAIDYVVRMGKMADLFRGKS